MTQRLPNWRSRLYNLISESESTPFKYGTHDCAIFAGKIVEAITGEDHYTVFEGKYKTGKGGFRKLKAATGFANHIDLITSTYEKIPVAFAREGDLGFVDTDEGDSVVTMLGSFAAGLGGDGIVRFPIEQVKTAFKVGI